MLCSKNSRKVKSKYNLLTINIINTTKKQVKILLNIKSGFFLFIDANIRLKR